MAQSGSIVQLGHPVVVYWRGCDFVQLGLFLSIGGPHCWGGKLIIRSSLIIIKNLTTLGKL